MWDLIHLNDSYNKDEGKFIFQKTDQCCHFAFASSDFVDSKEKENAGVRSSSDYDYSFK